MCTAAPAGLAPASVCGAALDTGGVPWGHCTRTPRDKPLRPQSWAGPPCHTPVMATVPAPSEAPGGWGLGTGGGACRQWPVHALRDIALLSLLLRKACPAQQVGRQPGHHLLPERRLPHLLAHLPKTRRCSKPMARLPEHPWGLLVKGLRALDTPRAPPGPGQLRQQG